MSKVKELETLYKKIENINEELKRNEYTLDLELENSEDQNELLIFDLRKKIEENYKELSSLNEQFFDVEKEIEKNNQSTNEINFNKEIKDVTNIDIINGFSDL
jgi:hypothetical protein